LRQNAPGRQLWVAVPQQPFGEPPTVAQAALERAASALCGLPLRLPQPLPERVEPALLAATYARRIGKGVAFAQAAFRQAFCAGKDLSDLDNVLIAAAACEIHPRALTRAVAEARTAAELAAAAEEAAAAGVRELPAVVAGGRVHSGLGELAQLLQAQEAIA